jgi:hypothetical protein
MEAYREFTYSLDAECVSCHGHRQGLIASLIARAIIMAVQFFGVNLTASFTAITSALL